MRAAHSGTGLRPATATLDCVNDDGAPATGARVTDGAGRLAETRLGIAAGAPAALGLVPIGLAFGLMVVQAGLPWWVAPALSIGVFAGSMELLLVGLLATGAPVSGIALTSLLVNGRHVFYAASFPLGAVRSAPGRAYSMYALTDEAYAVAAASPGGWTGPRLVAMQATIQVAWVAAGLAGVAIGAALPWRVEGLEFAMCALFVTLALDALRTRADVPSALLAGASVALAVVLTPASALFTALAIFSLALAVRFAVGRLRGRRA